MVLVASFVFTSVWCATPPSPSPAPSPALACHNGIASKAIACQNGAILHVSPDTYANASCHVCDCPPGWTGAACDLCTSTDICPPDASGHPPTGCSLATILPTAADLRARGAKRLSCECGGDDPSTLWVCSQSVGYNFSVDVSPQAPADPVSTSDPSASAKRYTLRVRERAPMPHQTSDPERFRYLYPQVWDATWSDCRAEEAAPCPATFPDGTTCRVYDCATSDMQCPAYGVIKCPGWSTLPPYCGPVSGSHDDDDHPDPHPVSYLQRNCSPITHPGAGVRTQLICGMEARDPTRPGQYQCYLIQEGGLLSSLGLHCTTGECTYD